MRLLPLIIAGLLILLSTTIAPQPSGAATSPDEVWTLPFEPTLLGHDETTSITVIEEHDPVAESRTLHGVDLTGAVQWSYSDVPDDSIWRSGFFISNGMLYLASGPPTGDSTLRVLAVDTGTIVNEWSLDGQLRELRTSDDLLWFTYADYVDFSWTDSTIGHLDPATGAITPAVITDPDHDVAFVDVASDNSFVIGAAAYQSIRWDLSGPSPVQTHSAPGRLLQLSNDDTQLFSPNGDRLDLVDPATLAITGTVDGEPEDFRTIHELSDGRLVSFRSGRKQEPLVVLLAANATHDILGRGISDRAQASNSATVVGNRIAYAERYSNQVRLFPLTPQLDLSTIGTIEAGRPFAFQIDGDFLASVDSVTLDGGSVLHSVEPASDSNNQGFRTAYITVEGAALTAGRHTIEVVGSLGAASAGFDVETGPDRRRFEATLRPDSPGATARVWMHCHHPNDSAISAEVSVQNIDLTRGQKVEIEPIVGHTCHLQAERLDTQTPGYENHIASGFYDPATDPSGVAALDLESWQVEFTMPDGDVGLSLFLPSLDQQVLWTYGYGVGTPADGDRTVTLDCNDPADDRSFDLYYGNWVRQVVPRESPCLVTHRTPAGALATGFGFYEPNGGGFTPPRQPRETTYYGGGQPTTLLVIYDIYPHPSEHNGAFARQQYLDFLGRQGDAGGLRFWEDALNSGTRARTDLVQLFLDSPEFGGTVAPVNRLYSAYFDRAPDREGLFFWVNWIREGRTLGQVSDEFARSAEFERAYGSLSDEDFIDLVYTNVLGRPADAGGRAFWIEQMASGTTRGQIMVNFSESPEYIEQTRAAVLVESLYQGLLQRSPDPQGFVFWTGQVEAGASIDALIGGMLSSDEYYNRFDNIYEQPPTSPSRVTDAQLHDDNSRSGLIGDNFSESLKLELEEAFE